MKHAPQIASLPVELEAGLDFTGRARGQNLCASLAIGRGFALLFDRAEDYPLVERVQARRPR
jgi:hypothetical protein